MRASGRTTRLIDKYIQDLFNNPNDKIQIKDHYPSILADEELFMKVLQRIVREHPEDHKLLKIDKVNHTIIYKPKK